MKTIKKFLASPTFLIVCMLLGIASFFGSYVIRFDNSVRFQNKALQEIQTTQDKVEELTGKINTLQNDNTELKKIICSLQKQVESLGATPIESIKDCNVN